MTAQAVRCPDAISYGHRSVDRRRRPCRLDSGHCPRSARDTLHADRKKGGAGIPAEDGAVQRPHDGDLSADGSRRQGSCGGARSPRPDGRLHNAGAQSACAPSVEIPFGRRGTNRDRRLRRWLDAARALPADFPIHARAAAEGRMRSPPGDQRSIRLRVRFAVAASRQRDSDRANEWGKPSDPRAVHRRVRRRRQRGAQAAGDSAAGRRGPAAPVSGALLQSHALRQDPDRRRARDRGATTTSPTASRRS